NARGRPSRGRPCISIDLWFYQLFVHHLDHAHHRMVLMEKNVTVVDVLPGEIEEAAAHRKRAMRRNQEGVVVTVRRIRLAVDCHHLEVVDMNMEGMPLLAGVVEHP